MILEPTLKFIPLREVISSDATTTLDLIVRIIPPIVETTLNRPKLNLGLVIDRSGSMSGQKIEYARQAACYAVQQLLPSDRISVTIYDDRVDILVPSTPALNKTEILRKIKTIQERGSTALHAGWVEGSVQVSQHLNNEQLNRVILLSDGLANVGETNPDIIASNVHGLAQRGVNTTTMGIGDDYNEDLLEAMAKSGDGNYYYIQSPQQLPDIFQSELQGIMATVGQKVSLGIEPQAEVMVLDVFNDLDKTRNDRYKLPNLIVGNPVDIAIRLKVPPMQTLSDICRFRLAWDNTETSQRSTLRATLKLPTVTSAQLSEFPVNPEVSQLIAQLMAARAKEEAVRNLDRGDRMAAKASLQLAIEQLAPLGLASEDLQDLDELACQVEKFEDIKMRKAATYQTYQKRRSRRD